GRAAGGAPERRALAVGDPRIERERRGLSLSREHDGPRRVDATAGGIVEVEVRQRRRIAEQLGIGGAGERGLLPETHELHGGGDEALDPAGRVPASSTSSGSPFRTLAESSAPERKTHSAMRPLPPRSRVIFKMRSPSSSNSASSRSIGALEPERSEPELEPGVEPGDWDDMGDPQGSADPTGVEVYPSTELGRSAGPPVRSSAIIHVLADARAPRLER